MQDRDDRVVYCGRCLLWCASIRFAWIFFVHVSAGGYATTLIVSEAEAVCWLFYVGAYMPIYICTELERADRLRRLRMDREKNKGTTQHPTV